MSTLLRTLIAVALVLAIGGTVVAGDVQTPSCRTALLVIDVQRGWVRAGRSATIDGMDVADKIAAILEPVRAAGIPVVFALDVSMRRTYSEALLALVHPLEALDGDLVVEKTHQNAFIETPLRDRLRAMGITTLLITGYASHECVRATVSGAIAAGFEVIIVEDGHSGGEGGRQAKVMNAAWRQRGLPVIASSEIDFAALCVFADR